MEKLSVNLFTIYHTKVLFFYMVDWLYWGREDEYWFFWTFVQFLIWPEGVANALISNLNLNQIGWWARRALRGAFWETVFYSKTRPLGQTGFFSFKNYKSRLSCGRTVFHRMTLQQTVEVTLPSTPTPRHRRHKHLRPIAQMVRVKISRSFLWSRQYRRLLGAKCLL